LDASNLLGWIAASLVLTSFYLKTIVPLRIVALASNLAFMAYGLMVDATPVYVLHSLLLPLNIFRLTQLWRAKSHIAPVSSDSTFNRILMPNMQTRRVAAGRVLFAAGEQSEAIYSVMDGELHSISSGTRYQAGDLIGVVDAFSADGRHLDTVVCGTDAILGWASTGAVIEALHREPAFGDFLLRAVARRAVCRKTNSNLPVGTAGGIPGRAFMTDPTTQAGLGQQRHVFSR
jgi:hypothetical protein